MHQQVITFLAIFVFTFITFLDTYSQDKKFIRKKIRVTVMDQIDSDRDGVRNDVDNCPNDFNPDQGDIDNDTKGDACDPLWMTSFGGRLDDGARSVALTSDGGFISTGYTYSLGNGDSDLLLVKTNQSGKVLWEKTFGGFSFDSGESIQETFDGGFIITGSTYSFGAGDCDVWLLKTDREGNLIWETTFGGSYCDQGLSVIETYDENYVVTGFKDLGENNNDLKLWVVKVDGDGYEIWNTLISGPSHIRGNSVQETNDDNLIIIGDQGTIDEKGEPAFCGSDIVAIKLGAANGNELWRQTYGEPHLIEFGYSLSQTRDGEFVLSGSQFSCTEFTGGLLLIKTDAKGNQMWNTYIGGKNVDHGYAIEETHDGGYIIGGDTSSYGAGKYDCWLVKTDSEGNELWSKTFGGTEDDYCYSVKETEDRGFILAGNTTANAKDFFLIKTDADGNVEN